MSEVSSGELSLKLDEQGTLTIRFAAFPAATLQIRDARPLLAQLLQQEGRQPPKPEKPKVHGYPKAMSPKVLAEIWDCSEGHIYKLVKSGELKHIRLGGKLTKILVEHVLEFERQHATYTRD